MRSRLALVAAITRTSMGRGRFADAIDLPHLQRAQQLDLTGIDNSPTSSRNTCRRCGFEATDALDCAR